MSYVEMQNLSAEEVGSGEERRKGWAAKKLVDITPHIVGICISTSIVNLSLYNYFLPPHDVQTPCLLTIVNNI